MNVIKIAHIPIDDLDLIQMKNSDGSWAVCMDHNRHFLAHSQYKLLRVEQNPPKVSAHSRDRKITYYQGGQLLLRLISLS